MPSTKIHILSTRPLDISLLQEAATAGIIVDVVSFIETIDDIGEEKRIQIRKLADQSTNVVFTSMNAVDAVAKCLSNKPAHWRIFCIGATTKQLVKNKFGNASIKGTAGSAAELADIIIQQNGIEEVIFFCGDQRRNDLPEKLSQNNIAINEIMVYRTIETPHTLDKIYDCILFFSPSAVKSFFSTNRIEDQTILFSIGNTTANEIRKYSNNKIIVGDEHGKENLLKKAIAFYEPQTLHNRQ